jgi:hypothetical protein
VVLEPPPLDGRAGGSRWRTVTVDADADGAPDPAAAPQAAIRPQPVRIELQGPFEKVYRTVTLLSQQQHLFVPDRWELTPASEGSRPGGDVRAVLRATVFVIQEPGTVPGAGYPRSGWSSADPGWAHLPEEKEG